MATTLQIQTFEAVLSADLQIVTPVGKPKHESHWLERTASPREEARILFEMMQRSGGTVESFRELIAIPPEIEEALTLYACKHPEDAYRIERVIRFRKRVATEFESVMRDGTSPKSVSLSTTPSSILPTSKDGQKNPRDGRFERTAGF